MLLRAVVLMAAVASVLGTTSPAVAGSLDDCAQRVIRDWYSGGRVDRIYPLPCYRAAIRALPDDVLQYSDAGAAIERALESARHRGTPDAAGAPKETPVAPARSAPSEKAAQDETAPATTHSSSPPPSATRGGRPHPPASPAAPSRRPRRQGSRIR